MCQIFQFRVNLLPIFVLLFSEFRVNCVYRYIKNHAKKLKTSLLNKI